MENFTGCRTFWYLVSKEQIGFLIKSNLPRHLKARFLRLLYFIILIHVIHRRYYWLHNFIINFQSRSKFSTLYVFFIVRICKVGPSPGVAAAVPVWGSWGPLHTLFQGCVLGCPIRASSWSSGGRLRQLVSFLSVNLELKQNLCI